MILSIEGEEATGKSTLAYTAPLPIVAFSLDMGSDRAIYGTQYSKFFEGLEIVKHKYRKDVKPEAFGQADITIYELPAPIQLDDTRLMGYAEQWDYFINLYSDALMADDQVVRTIVVDTMTLLRKNKCDAYLQELQENSKGKPRKQLMQIEYGHPDGAIRNLYTFAQSLGKNLVATHHLRDHYAPGMDRDGNITSQPDGTQELDGVKDTLRYVDVALRNVKKGGQLSSRYMKCGPNLSYEGSEIPNATWDKVVDMLELGYRGPRYDRRAAGGTE